MSPLFAAEAPAWAIWLPLAAFVAGQISGVFLIAQYRAERHRREARTTLSHAQPARWVDGPPVTIHTALAEQTPIRETSLHGGARR